MSGRQQLEQPSWPKKQVPHLDVGFHSSALEVERNPIRGTDSSGEKLALLSTPGLGALFLLL